MGVRRSLAVLCLAVGGVLVVDAGLAGRAGAAPATVAGHVFRDDDQDGARQAGAAAVAGVEVTVSGPGGEVLGAGVSGTDGGYSIDLSAASTTAPPANVRIAFTIPAALAPLRPGPVGADSHGDVVFAAPGATVDFGVADPARFCATATLYVACQVRGDGGRLPGVVRVARHADGTFGRPSAVVNAGAIGASYGLAVRADGAIFTATTVKRHTAYGPAGAVAAIELTDAATGATAPLVSWPGALTAHDATGNYASDDAQYDRAGREGIGDIDLSADGSTLYAVDLSTARLHSIALTGSGAATRAALHDGVAIPSPCATPSDAHPYGLGVHGATVLVGGVCGADSTVTAAAPFGDPGALVAYVYAFDGGAFAPAPALVVPLDYARACVYSDAGTSCDQVHPSATGDVSAAGWTAWNARLPEADYQGVVSSPQPIVSDLAVTAAGDLVVGLRDRFGDMQGNLDAVPGAGRLVRAVTAGDLLRACVVGGGYVVEGAAGCPQHAADGEGPSGGEWYPGDRVVDSRGRVIYSETTLGAVTVDPLDDSVLATSFDNGRSYDHVVRRFGGDGLVSGSVVVRSGTFNDQRLFASGNGLGDVELVCDRAPVELGDRVWNDVDGDGVQGAAEPGIAGVMVSLYDSSAATAAPVATTLTGADGGYRFRGVSAGHRYRVALDRGADYAAGGPLDGVEPTVAGAAGDRRLDSDGIVASAAGAVGVEAAVTIGGAGEHDEGIDFGFRRPGPTTTTTTSPTVVDTTTTSSTVVDTTTSTVVDTTTTSSTVVDTTTTSSTVVDTTTSSTTVADATTTSSTTVDSTTSTSTSTSTSATVADATTSSSSTSTSTSVDPTTSTIDASTTTVAPLTATTTGSTTTTIAAQVEGESVTAPTPTTVAVVSGGTVDRLPDTGAPALRELALAAVLIVNGLALLLIPARRPAPAPVLGPPHPRRRGR